MAVYTQITKQDLIAFLEQYDLGALLDFKGIAQGVSNTNYHVFTDQGRYILTIFEPRRVLEKDLDFFFDYSAHLQNKGIECPAAILRKDGKSYGFLKGLPAVFITYLHGQDIKTKDLAEDHCEQMGAFLARMHLAAQDFSGGRENNMGVSSFPRLYDIIKDKADGFEQGLNDLMKAELDYLQKEWPSELPAGCVHADAFPDNVFFYKEKLSAIIDFYFSCTDFYAFDLAITMNAWCFDENAEFVTDRFKAFMQGYQTARPLSAEEKSAFRVLCRGAVYRTLASRLEEYFMHDPENTVMIPHDPRAYLKRLQFHQQQDIMTFV